MQVLIKLVLLGLTLVLVFINPAYIGRATYYALFPLLFVLAWVFYRITYHVSEKLVRSSSDVAFSFSLFCAMVPSLGDGDLIRGRLLFTPTDLILYQRTAKGQGLKQVWSVPIKDVKKFTLGPVLSVRKGITFHTENGDVKFVLRNAQNYKQLITKALGWDTESSVGVGDEAASSPSFTEIQKL